MTQVEETTILYKMKRVAVDTTIPAIGFIMERFAGPEEHHAHRGQLQFYSDHKVTTWRPRSARTSSSTVELTEGCVTEFKDLSAQQQQGSHHSFDPKLASAVFETDSVTSTPRDAISRVGRTTRRAWSDRGCVLETTRECPYTACTRHSTKTTPRHRTDRTSWRSHGSSCLDESSPQCVSAGHPRYTGAVTTGGRGWLIHGTKSPNHHHGLSPW